MRVPSRGSRRGNESIKKSCEIYFKRRKFLFYIVKKTIFQISFVNFLMNDKRRLKPDKGYSGSVTLTTYVKIKIIGVDSLIRHINPFLYKNEFSKAKIKIRETISNGLDS